MLNKAHLLGMLWVGLGLFLSPVFCPFLGAQAEAKDYVRSPWSIRYRRYNLRRGPIWKAIQRLIAQHVLATQSKPGTCKSQAPKIKRDERHGFERHCLGRNNIVEEGKWWLGELNGLWTISTSGGRKIAQIPYVKGRLEGTIKIWHRNGRPWVTCNYRNEYKHGVCWWWYFNGKPLSVATYRDNDRHGKVVRWFRDGRKMSSCTYQYDLPHGHCVRWFLNGNKLWDRHYKDGKAFGTWRMWYRNGRLLSIRRFHQGKPCNLTKFWRDDGSLVSQTSYPPCPKPSQAKTPSP